MLVLSFQWALNRRKDFTHRANFNTGDQRNVKKQQKEKNVIPGNRIQGLYIFIYFKSISNITHFKAYKTYFLFFLS